MKNKSLIIFSFEIENEEKIMQRNVELQKQSSLLKEQNIRYKAEIDHIKE